MKLIEIHLLQSFSAACLNRDDVGAPKSITFGGVQRARVSSQCWKRAMRQKAYDLTPEYFAGQRGHYQSAILEKKLVNAGIDAVQAAKIAKDVFEELAKKDKKEGQTKVALYISDNEIDALANSIIKILQQPVDNAAAKGKKEKKLFDNDTIAKAIKNARPHDFADIAIFGRMVASAPSLTLEAAGMFSHAISTHAVSNEVDFFSAIDDTKPEDNAGAGHIGVLEMNSACYYRYIGINVDLLFDNDHLGHLDNTTRKTILNVFLKSVIEAVPGARKNSMFSFTLPQFAAGFVRRGQPLSLINAFETPVKAVKGGGYITPSIDALENHWNSLKKLYQISADEYRLNEDLTIDTWIDSLISKALEE